MTPLYLSIGLFYITFVAALIGLKDFILSIWPKWWGKVVIIIGIVVWGVMGSWQLLATDDAQTQSLKGINDTTILQSKLVKAEVKRAIDSSSTAIIYAMAIGNQGVVQKVDSVRKLIDSGISLATHTKSREDAQKDSALGLKAVEDINEKFTKLEGEITGGGFKPKLTCRAFKTGSDTSYTILLTIINNGPYLIRDCSLDITEYRQLSNNADGAEAKQKVQSITLQPNSSKVVFENSVPLLKSSNFYQYTVDVRWERGFYRGVFYIYPVVGNKRDCEIRSVYMLENLVPMPIDYFK